MPKKAIKKSKIKSIQKDDLESIVHQVSAREFLGKFITYSNGTCAIKININSSLPSSPTDNQQQQSSKKKRQRSPSVTTNDDVDSESSPITAAKRVDRKQTMDRTPAPNNVYITFNAIYSRLKTTLTTIIKNMPEYSGSKGAPEQTAVWTKVKDSGDFSAVTEFLQLLSTVLFETKDKKEVADAIYKFIVSRFLRYIETKFNQPPVGNNDVVDSGNINVNSYIQLEKLDRFICIAFNGIQKSIINE
jgi:hypothetical protein